MKPGETDQPDNAVSPVVGVMLMLAITVMIAAIVSAAAGGLSASEKKAPSATLDVTIYAAKTYGDCTVPSMTIRHVSGAVLPTRDLQLVLYYRPPGSGILVKGNLSGQHAVTGDDAWSHFKSTKYCGVLYLNDDNRFEIESPEKMLRDSDTGFKNWFGNASATFGPGDILVTPARFCDSADTAHQKNPSMEYLFPGVDLKNDFKAGSVVTVKIIHMPSGQLIFDNDVVIV